MPGAANCACKDEFSRLGTVLVSRSKLGSKSRYVYCYRLAISRFAIPVVYGRNCKACRRLGNTARCAIFRMSMLIYVHLGVLGRAEEQLLIVRFGKREVSIRSEK